MPLFDFFCPKCGHVKKDVLKTQTELKEPEICDGLIPLTDFVELPDSKENVAWGQVCGEKMQIKIGKTNFRIS